MNGVRCNVYHLALAATVLVLAGCSDMPVEQSDRAPTRQIAAHEVIEPSPRPDPILAAGNTSPYVVHGKEYQVMETSDGYRERGRASWYGLKFNGRPTANGETYDVYAATAAHRTLPIPCYVRVTNLENGRSMVVRVNDRGPFHSERIIDLSYGAAIKLGFADAGTAAVEIAVLGVAGVVDRRSEPGFSSAAYRYVQVGSFGNASAARSLSLQLHQQLQAPVVVAQLQMGNKTWHRVRVGPIEDQDRLLGLQLELEKMGYENARMMPDE
jgi:rare lipoprotein A